MPECRGQPHGGQSHHEGAWPETRHSCTGGLCIVQLFAIARHTCSRSFFFFVLIRLLREPLTPEMLTRLQALSPDLLLRRLVASSDPSDSESCLRVAVLNYKLIPNLYLASVTTQSHTMVRDIESMREMALSTSSDPETHWHDRFGSLRPPFPCTKFHAH